jgi:hypothetical protein
VGFSVRIAPGVRVRASSRGVRTSLGPRAARIHVGGGRTGLSTGMGPVSYYTSLGNSRRTPSRTASGTAAAQRHMAAAARAQDKQEAARALEAAVSVIANLHRTVFEAAQPPVAPVPPAVEAAKIRAKHRREAKTATKPFTGKRRSALEDAERRTRVEVDAATVHYQQARAGWQATLDHRWAALNVNDPETVMAVLAEAFEDNEAPAAAIGVEGAEVTLVVVVPPASTMPERRPTTTAAGNLSLKKLTKTETADLYKTFVCGHVLITANEAFAVAPNLTSGRVVAVRSSPSRFGGGDRPEVLLATRFERQRLSSVPWSQMNALQVVNEASSELILVQKGVTKQLTPIDLDKEPGLAAVVDAVAFEDLA